MKRTTTLLALLACAALAVAPAEAGLFKKSKPAADEGKVKTWRYDRLPTMSFHKGQLRNESMGVWKVGELTLQLAPDCRIVDGGRPGSLATGRTAIVMGPRIGGTIVAWRVDVQPHAHAVARPTRGADTQIEWSQSDPTVGRGTGPE